MGRMGGNASARQNLGLPEASTVSATVLDLGALTPESAFVRALAQILKRFPDHVHLFAGPGGIRRIRTFLHDEGVLPQVRFMGNVSDLDALLAASDVYLASFTPDDEGVTAATKAGVPVVQAEGTSVPRYVQDAVRLLGRREARD